MIIQEVFGLRVIDADEKVFDAKIILPRCLLDKVSKLVAHSFGYRGGNDGQCGIAPAPPQKFSSLATNATVKDRASDSVPVAALAPVVQRSSVKLTDSRAGRRFVLRATSTPASMKNPPPGKDGAKAVALAKVVVQFSASLYGLAYQLKISSSVAKVLRDTFLRFTVSRVFAPPFWFTVPRSFRLPLMG